MLHKNKIWTDLDQEVQDWTPSAGRRMMKCKNADIINEFKFKAALKEKTVKSP